MVKSSKKQEFEDIKKTAEAYGTLSEEVAKKITEEGDKVTEEMLKKDIKKEQEVEKELDIVKDVNEEEKELITPFKKEDILGAWEPKTKIGKDVKSGKIKNIDEILDSGKKILEEQIVDALLNVQVDLIFIGQAKGKFGGGKRRVWRQTQKKTNEGNVPIFSAMAVVGDENGHIGIGVGKAKETLPARDKAIRNAKLNIIKIKRGCSAFDCLCAEPHTVPFKVSGKEGSSEVILIPAPQGTGLVAGSELKKILKLAGIKDVYTKTFGKRRTTFNFIKACFNALKKTNTIKKRKITLNRNSLN